MDTTAAAATVVEEEKRIPEENEVRIRNLFPMNVCNGGFIYSHFKTGSHPPKVGPWGFTPLKDYSLCGEYHGHNKPVNKLTPKSLYDLMYKQGEEKALMITEFGQKEVNNWLAEISRQNNNKWLEVFYLAPWRKHGQYEIAEFKDEAEKRQVPNEKSTLWMIRRKFGVME